MSWRGGRGRGGGGGTPRGRGGFRRDFPPTPPRGRDPAIQARENIIFLADQEDFNVSSDVPALARYLRDKWAYGAAPGILDGFAWGINESPHKLPYYAALLLVLSKEEFYIDPAPTDRDPITDRVRARASALASDPFMAGPPSTEPKEQAEAAVEAALGDEGKMSVDGDEEKSSEEQAESRRKQRCLSWLILQDLGSRFTEWVDKRMWLNARLAVSFFGHLVPIGLVSAESYLATLKSFISVLEELGGGGKRAEKVIRVVTEGLLRAGPSFYDSNRAAVDSIIATISSSVTSREDSRALHNNFFLPAEVARGDITPESDQLDNILSTLRAAQSSGFTKISWMPEPARRFMREEGDNGHIDVYSLPQVTVPPEAEGESVLSRALEGEGLIGTFTLGGKIGLTDGRVPNPSTPDGWIMQSMILDILSIYEVNRIKCAELLLKLTDFCLLDIFRGKPSAGEEEAEDIAVPGEWILASTLISIILSAMFRLPKSPHHVIYLTSVVRELCLANGPMMAPPVGLAMRNIFSDLGNGLDVEISRRTAEWFSVHLSNFAYQWMWKAWVPDLDLPMTHPKRAFMHRLIELEVRLAYQERVLETLPEEMQDEKDAPALRMPDPVFEYEESEHPKYDDASEVLNLLNAKESSEAVIAKIRELSGCTASSDVVPHEYRQIAVHAILQVGSRSFSHFLNATERYLKVIQEFAHTQKGRRELLGFVRDFWTNSSQMRVMVIDKYLQYNLVDYEDVVAATFGAFSAREEGVRPDWPTVWTDYHAWELLSNALTKSKGRLIAISKRIAQTEKEDEAVRAKRNAMVDSAAAANIGEDGDVAIKDETEESKPDQVSKEVQALLQRRTELQADQTRLVTLVVTSFVDSLVPGRGNGIAVPSQLDKVIDGDYNNPLVWDTLARVGFYREFMRSYGNDVKASSDTLDAVFQNLPLLLDPTAASSDLAARLVRIIYEQAVTVQ